MDLIKICIFIFIILKLNNYFYKLYILLGNAKFILLKLLSIKFVK